LSIKIKFKDERLNLENDKKRLAKEVVDGHEKLEQAHSRFFALKTEVDSSPLQVLRTELGQKQLEISDLNSKIKQANMQVEDYKFKFD
jgi:chromosome segregation ATPase